MHYKEFQYSWPLIFMLIPIQFLIAVIYWFQWGDNPMPFSAFIGLNILFLVALLIFYGMKTEVTSTNVLVSFGIGIIKKKFKLTDIKTAEAVITPWYYGWGVRFIPNGMLYNTSGSKSVELKFHSTSKVFRIGTQKPNQLEKQLKKAITDIKT